MVERVYVYFHKIDEPYPLDVVDSGAVKNRIATEMQHARGVITIGVRGGRMVVLDTATIRMVA